MHCLIMGIIRPMRRTSAYFYGVLDHGSNRTFDQVTWSLDGMTCPCNNTLTRDDVTALTLQFNDIKLHIQPTLQ
jgi:hypothetical protein